MRNNIYHFRKTGEYMKNTKIILSLSFLSAFIITLCTCGILSPSVEFMTLDTSTLGDVSIISCDSNEKYSVLFYMDHIEEWTEDANGSADEIPCYLSVFDNKKNREIEKTQFVCKENYDYEVLLTDEGFSLLNRENDEVINYDFELKNSKTTTYNFRKNYDKAKNIPSIDPDKFNCFDDFAISDSYKKIRHWFFTTSPTNSSY